MNQFQQSSTHEDEISRRAVLVGQSNIGNSFLFVAVGLYLAITTHAWQSFVFAASVTVTTVTGFAAVALLRRGKLRFGGWVLLGLNIIGTMITALLFVGLGYVAAAYLLIVAFFVIRYVLPKDSTRWASLVVIASLLIFVATEVVHPLWRQTSNLMLTISPFLTALLGIVFLVIVGYQAWAVSMRNKLLIALISTTLITAASLSVYIYTSTTNTLRQGLAGELKQHTDGVAQQISALFNEQVNSLTILSLNDILQNSVETANSSYQGDVSVEQATLKARDDEWQAANAADNNADPLVQQVLNTPASQQLRKFQKAFPDHVELFITDIKGGLVAATARTSDYYQADEDWWTAAYNKGQGAVYISEPKYDQSAGAFGIQMALPIRNQETNQLVGIIRTTYQTSALTPILGELVDKTGETDLYIPGRPAFIFHHGQLDPMDPNVLNKLQNLVGHGMVEMDYVNESFPGISPATPSVVIQTSMKALGENTEFNKLGWVVLYHQSQSEAYAPISSGIRGALIVILIVVLLTVAGASVLSLFLVRPITQLTQTAEEIAKGNLNSRAQISSTDEIGTLAGTLNRMTSQLQETLQGLEQRITARTKDLATVAEVSTATATILETQALLQAVVDLSKERFDLYHAHIYLLDEAGENLVLTAGAGEPGRIMAAEKRSISIHREQSLVARAAREQKGVIVNDVTQAPDFLPNPLLPETRAELAVPMIVGGNVIGVFDVQSEQVGRFTEADISVKTTLAAQVATSIQNVRSFEQSRKQAELESMVNTIGQKIQRTTSIEETLQTAIRELGTAIGASRVKASISAQKDGSNN